MTVNLKFALIMVLLFCVGSCSPQSVTDRIVIVGVETYDPELLYKEIQNICALNPKVIAVDIQFPELINDYLDTLLRSALQSCDKVILPSQIRGYTYEDKNYQDTLGTHPFFLSNGRTGFVNVILEYDKFSTLKRFSIKETVNGEVEYHFAVLTAMMYDSIKTISYIKKKPKIIDIEYQKDQMKFKKIRGSYAINNGLDREDIEGKIVLLGSFWPIEGEPPDVFVSPLNDTPEQGADMWGVVYLANVIAQILE